MALKFLFDRKKMYIYPWYISDLTATREMKKIIGVAVKRTFFVFEKDYLIGYYDGASTKKIGRVLMNKILHEKRFFEKVVAMIYRYSRRMETFCGEVESLKVGKINDRRLADVYKKYISILSALRAWGWTPVFLDGLEKSFLSEYIQKEFGKILKKKKMEAFFGAYYSVLTSSEKESEVQKEESERLAMLKKIASLEKAKIILAELKNGQLEKTVAQYPEIKKLAERHIKRFGWLTYAYSGPIMAMEHLSNLIKDSLQEDIAARIGKIKNHYKNIHTEKARIIKELDLPEKLAYLFNVSAELMYIKDYRKGIYQKSYVAMDPVLEEIGRRIGASLIEMKYLSAEEISAALLKNKKDHYRDIAKQRVEKCCYIVEDGKIKIFEGEQREKMIKKYVGKLAAPGTGDAEMKEIKGTTAYGGKVQGRVKIVLIVEDVAKMEDGDILVSSSTNPDLILAMKKAGAFVTDIGGIISHAAIVAREMKKPCVVGTKIATHILKDGDLVEVDANIGVVKILK